MDYVIEKNIPMPIRSDDPLIHVFKKMEITDSVVLDVAKPIILKAAAKAGINVVIAKQNGGNGYRVWRDNDVKSEEKGKIVDYIRRHKKNEVSRREIVQAFRFSGLNILLENLVKSGVLMTTEVRNLRGRPTVLYRIS